MKPTHLPFANKSFLLIALQFWAFYPKLATASPQNQAQGKQESAKVQASQKIDSPVEILETRNKKFQSLEAFSRVLNHLETMYVDEKSVSSDVLIERALKGMVSSLDPHTAYLPVQQLRELTNDTSGKFGGIGVVLSQQNGKLEIIEVVPDTPASKAKLQPGDVIVAVDGIQINKNNIEDVLNKLRGLPGSSVRLEIQPAPETAGGKTSRPPLRNLQLVREIIKSQSVVHQSLSPGYVYIRVGVFQEDSSEQVDKFLRKYEAENNGKLRGLVLDLRSNPGGLLDQAVRIADLFLDSGIIVSTVGRDRARQEVEYASKRHTHPYMPLVVLVNEASASASEIVAGALQDHNRALVVGMPTFGKGSVQQIIPLPNGAGLKMTVARYYTPSGRSIQAKGITPDVNLPANPSSRSALKTAPGANTDVMKDEDSQSTPAPRGSRKEVDLEGHIESTDLSNSPSNLGFASDIEKWPTNLKNDYQLKMGYTYLRSWARFAQN
ncbi:MAG: S41 family peptidase [Silvanigrellaceae bacterium]